VLLLLKETSIGLDRRSRSSRARQTPKLTRVFLAVARRVQDLLVRSLVARLQSARAPSYADIPIDFRVSLLKNAPNPVGTLSSKIVGEPPVSLSCAAAIAVQQAVIAAKLANNQDIKNFGLNAPVIPENVLTNTKVYPS